jgi:hypothetical protein
MLPWLAHLAPVWWLFGPALRSGWLLYFRDLSTYYAPGYVFAAESLHRHVWPLWNPTANAGEPFLLAYPPDLVLLALWGWRACLGLGPALHLLVALTGGTRLARQLGAGPWGAWLAGTVYGLGGLSLSLINLAPLHQAAAWAPWVVAAFVAASRAPSWRRLAQLALLLALQVSTLGAEIVLQTVLVGFVLSSDGWWRQPARMARLALAGALAGVVAAPALLGARALLAGTARARGFPLVDALAFSLHPVALVEAVLPRWLGTPHAFSSADYWGSVYFETGFPYLLSLYLGLPVLLLALQARGGRRLWMLVGLGLVLSLGRYGPLGLLPGTLMVPLRGPVKLFFTCHLGLSLLAGQGLDRRLGEGLRGAKRVWAIVPGLVLLGAGVASLLAPAALQNALALLVSAVGSPRATLAARATWPGAWLPAALLAVAAAVALARGGRTAVWAGVLALLDLVSANGSLNPLASPSFYDLRAGTSELVRPAHAGGGRLFSYGVAQTPGLRFEPIMARAASDVWLYYLDRQSLLPWTMSLDGFDGALDVDRTGWSPALATLDPREAVPGRFREYHKQLELAAVRWVLSFSDLPRDLVQKVGAVKLPEIVPPLTLYELPGAVSRAFFVTAWQVEPDAARAVRRLAEPGFDPRSVVLVDRPPRMPSTPPASAGTPAPEVRYTRPDPHTVRIEAETPPGLIVVADGYDPAWTVEQGSRPVELLRADGRYRAFVTPGGRQVFVMRFRPQWPRPALALSAFGFVVLVLAAALDGLRGAPARPPTPC